MGLIDLKKIQKRKEPNEDFCLFAAYLGYLSGIFSRIGFFR